MENMNIGKNKSFMCSHVDSFIAEKVPTIIELLDNLYAKCRKDPKNTEKKKPTICHIKIAFVIIFPQFNIWPKKQKIYYTHSTYNKWDLNLIEMLFALYSFDVVVFPIIWAININIK